MSEQEDLAYRPLGPVVAAGPIWPVSPDIDHPSSRRAAGCESPGAPRRSQPALSRPVRSRSSGAATSDKSTDTHAHRTVLDSGRRLPRSLRGDERSQSNWRLPRMLLVARAGLRPRADARRPAIPPRGAVHERRRLPRRDIQRWRCRLSGGHTPPARSIAIGRALEQGPPGVLSGPAQPAQVLAVTEELKPSP
jgi:hypothetical protein